MKVRRYQMSDEIEVCAPVEKAYAIASDPEIVPSYAPEIARIELIKRLDEHRALVRISLRIFKLTLTYLYRYHYRSPTHYGGTQERGRLLRGYFNFTFKSRGDRTLISHSEGILSPVPCLAGLVGFVYFRVLSHRGVRDELRNLKALIESGIAYQARL
ncbi:MAG: Polyketide cyclase / dehydrase and lipid transport [Acidobacteriota bacterium]|jgi:hypothetical protein|nr:Polyketide cyclase / dehydrase and lipid transport [Acidobacteriota bacterium]